MSEDRISARAVADCMWPGKRPAPVPNGITKQAGEGLIGAWAELLTRQGTGEKTSLRDCPIPAEFWSGRSMIPDWEMGIFTAKVRQGDHEEEWQAFDVKFERSRVEMLAPQNIDTGASLGPQAGKVRSQPVGRHPDAIWESVMIELGRQLYAGDLKPMRLADVEKAIADFLCDQDSSMSESTIREHARPFWNMCEREAGK